MYTILNPFNNLLFPNTAPYEVVNKRWMDGMDGSQTFLERSLVGDLQERK